MPATRKKTKRKVGRPTRLNKSLQARLMARLAVGESLRSIVKDPKMPSMTTVFRWLGSNDDFREQYELAKAESADAYADEIVDIADNEACTDLVIDGVPVLDPETGEPYKIVTAQGVQHARLRVDARKWVSSKLKPKKYGDKVTNEHQALDKEGQTANWEVTFVNADMVKDEQA